MKILAIDPGHTQSAWLEWDGEKIGRRGIDPNDKVLGMLAANWADALVVEQIASFGMAVGAEVFETVFWSGRFVQVWSDLDRRWDRIKRLPVKASPGPLYGIKTDLWAALAVAVTWFDQNCVEALRA